MLGYVAWLTIGLAAMASSDQGGCRCTRESAPAGRSQSQCPRACTLDYAPICGFNPCQEGGPDGGFRTFSNKCLQEATSCDGPEQFYYYVYNGECDAKYGH